VQWVIDGTPGDDPALVTSFAGSGTSIASVVGGAIGDGLTLGLGRTDNDDLNFVALIRALSGDSDSNLLSTPSIVTLDNQEAEIVVGQNVPFVTGEFSSTTTGSTSNAIANPFRTIERQDVGISLKVKPQINEGNSISMDIQQEVSNISGSSTGAVDLITNKRSLKTTVMLEDGELLVLGGLIDEELIEVQQKVPGLGDIPILGALFRSKSVQKRKRNLLVFIRASIIKDIEKARMLSHSKYNFMRNDQLMKAEKHDSMNPVLPELEIVIE
jgi:general secretion pathway protein D